MKQRFFISGMPRSGTAWVSALLSLCPNALCLHEVEIRDEPTLMDQLDAQPFEFVGQSAPRAKHPIFDAVTANRVALTRNFDDAVKASRKAFHGLMTPEHVHHECTRLNDWIALHKPLIIPFNSLFSLAAARAIWNHVLPWEAFPVKKIELLIKTRVTQVIPTKEQMLEMAQLEII